MAIQINALLLFQGKRVVPANKRKSSKRFNRTRTSLKHNIKTAELQGKIHELMCFLTYSVNMRVKGCLFHVPFPVCLLGFHWVWTCSRGHGACWYDALPDVLLQFCNPYCMLIVPEVQQCCKVATLKRAAPQSTVSSWCVDKNLSTQHSCYGGYIDMDAWRNSSGRRNKGYMRGVTQEWYSQQTNSKQRLQPEKCSLLTLNFTESLILFITYQQRNFDHTAEIECFVEKGNWGEEVCSTEMFFLMYECNIPIRSKSMLCLNCLNLPSSASIFTILYISCVDAVDTILVVQPSNSHPSIHPVSVNLV